MLNSYNANMYLSPTDLNNIENKIQEITRKIRLFVFEGFNNSLRNIRVGDNLGGKTIYLSFPRDSYENINNTTRTDIIDVDDNTRIAYIYNTSSAKKYIYVRYKGVSYYIYAKNDDALNPYLSFIRYTLPLDFGTVSQINSSDNFYQYIKVYNEENIIPDYEKNVWSINDILTMKKIDNIEQGIKNIGDYYYKPNGWLGSKEWLGTARLGQDNNYALNTRNISYLDLNRWNINLDSIKSYNINDLTLWNTIVSQIDWNTESNIEWEDL